MSIAASGTWMGDDWSAEALTHNTYNAVTAGIWRVQAGSASSFVPQRTSWSPETEEPKLDVGVLRKAIQEEYAEVVAKMEGVEWITEYTYR